MTIESQPELAVPRLVLETHERCRYHLSPTFLEQSHYLSELIEREVWLKLYSVQKTSSFKCRGALSKILARTEEDLERHLVTASTGNSPPCCYTSSDRTRRGPARVRRQRL